MAIQSRLLSGARSHPGTGCDRQKMANGGSRGSGVEEGFAIGTELPGAELRPRISPSPRGEKPER